MHNSKSVSGGSPLFNYKPYKCETDNRTLVNQTLTSQCNLPPNLLHDKLRYFLFATLISNCTKLIWIIDLPIDTAQVCYATLNVLINIVECLLATNCNPNLESNNNFNCLCSFFRVSNCWPPHN